MRKEFIMAGSFCILSTAAVGLTYLRIESSAKDQALEQAALYMDAAKAYNPHGSVATCGSGALRETSSTGKDDGQAFAMRVIATREGCEKPLLVTYHRLSSRRGWRVEDLDVTGG